MSFKFPLKTKKTEQSRAMSCLQQELFMGAFDLIDFIPQIAYNFICIRGQRTKEGW